MYLMSLFTFFSLFEFHIVKNNNCLIWNPLFYLSFVPVPTTDYDSYDNNM